MSTQVQYRRGTASQNNAFTGALAEITVDTTNQTLRVHDGITAGGSSLVGLTASQTLTNKIYQGTSVSVTGNVTGGNVTTAGVVSATGNVSGGNIAGTTGAFVTVTGNANATSLTSGTVPSARLSGSYTIDISGAATTAATVTTAAQPNITSVGTLTSVSVSGNVTGGNLVTAGVVSATGNISGNFILGNGSQLTGIDATSIQNGNSSVSVIASGGNVRSNIGGATVSTLSSGGLAVTGTVSATGNISGGNLSGTSIVGTLTTAAQTNITSVGTLTALAVTGNTTSGNFIGVLNGSGANVSSISATNISSGTLDQARLANAAVTLGSTALTLGDTVTTVAGLTSVTSTTFVGALTGAATTAGTVTTAAQPNITSVGTLTSVSVTGNVTAGNVNAGNITIAGDLISSLGTTLTIDPATVGNAGLVVINGNLQVNGTTTTINSNVVSTNDLTVNYANNAINSAAANGGGIEIGPIGSPFITWLYNDVSNVFTSSGGISAVGNISGGNLSGTSIVGTLTTAAQTNITSVGTLDALSVTGNITGGNLSGTSIVGTLTTVAQTNITSVGTLTALSVTGNITGGNILTAGLVSLSSITKTGSNGVGNIGAAASTFDTVFAKATSAQYADVAERYQADCDYAPGTVLIIGGSHEVTASTVSHDHRAAGVVSENPSYLMNSALDTLNSVAVALLGRVPCRVIGPIDRGDLLATSTVPGTAGRLDPARYLPGCVIGKALQDYHSEQPGTIEIAVGVK